MWRGLVFFGPLWAVTLGCSDPAVLHLPFPDDQSVQSAFIATKQSDQLRVFAVGVSESGALLPALGEFEDGAIAMELALYDEPLSVRGIPEGELFSSDGVPPERRVPPSSRVYATTIEGGQAESWFSLGRLSNELAAFRFPGIDPVDPCTQFTAERIELHPTEVSLSTLAFSEDELVVFTTGATYGVRRDAVQVLSLDLAGTSTYAQSVIATTKDPAGRAFGSLGDGTIVALERVGATVIASARGRVPLPTHRNRWLAVGELEGEPESFVLTSSGALFRHHLGATSVLHQFTGDETLSGAVSVIGPNEALAVFRYNAGKVLHYDRGLVEEEMVPTTVLDRLVSLIYLPELGALVGTDDGKIFQRQAGGFWVKLVDEPSAEGLTVTSFYSDPAGFSFGAGYADTNVLGRWIEADRRLCLTELGPIGTRPRVTRVGESFAVLGSRGGLGALVHWLSPAE